MRLPALFFLPFHGELSLSVESPDAQADGQKEETEHETGLSIEPDVNPAPGVEEQERGDNDDKPPYADLQDLMQIRSPFYRASVMGGEH